MLQWLCSERAYPIVALTVFSTSFLGVFVWAYWPLSAPSRR